MLKNIALSVLLLGFILWAATPLAPRIQNPGSAALGTSLSLSPPCAPTDDGGGPQKKSTPKTKAMFKKFHGVVEVEGHRTSGIPGLTNFVETIHGTINFEGINDVVTASSGSLTYGMSGWNKNETIPCGRCLHKVSGTVQASFESPVSTMVGAADAKRMLTDEQKKQFKGAEFFLSALANFEFRISSYTTDCCGKIIPMPPGTYVQTMQPLVIPGNFVPFKFTATIDGWSGDIFFSIKSFSGSSK